MKILMYDTKPYDQEYFDQLNTQFDITYTDQKLNSLSAKIAQGYLAVCPFVNCDLSRQTLETLKTSGVGLIALRSAGYNNVDLSSAAEFGIKVTRVPAYSPEAVAEHAVALLMTLNRKIHKAYNRVREGNFSLQGLVGFDVHGKTIGVVGTGKIGKAFIRIMQGFGAKILAHDPIQDPLLIEQGVDYTDLDTLLQSSKVVSLHLPLTPSTRHLLNTERLSKMPPGSILINTSRGALVETKGLITALKTRHLGGACLDVYEQEQSLFFADHSGDIIDDDILARLLTFPNVVLTSHQGFLTHEALTEIAKVTLANIWEFKLGHPLTNQVILK